MAYITSEQVAEKRNQLKKIFPSSKGWKLSITKDHHTGINAAIMEYPKGYNFPGYEQINHYYLDKCGLGKKEVAILKKITDVCMQGNHDNSDIMTDYFDIGWFFNLAVGKWDKPAKQSAK